MASFQSNKYPARLDALLSDLKSYRQSLQSKTFSENPLSGLNNLSIAKTSSNDGEFLKLVDVNILLVAFGLPTPICWPYALAAGFSERTVDLRFMESHGSIWRILRRPDPNPGTRILLQTNEIAEKPMYLSAELTLVESQEAAAVWSIYSSKSTGRPTSTISGEYKSSDLISRPTTIIKLELFEGLQGIAKPSDSKCLASVVTTSGQVAIALISENEASEQQQHQGRMDGFNFSFLWEVMLENTEIGYAPEFFSDEA